MSAQKDIERVRQVYSTVYRPDPDDRSYLWHPRNPVSIYYRQALERALVHLFNRHNLSLEDMTVLDAGCGHGNWLRFFAALGASPQHLHGVDLMHYRVQAARQGCPPQVRLQVGSLDHLPYPSQCFDLVSVFTVFSSIFSTETRQQAAGEIQRVLKEGGYVLWYDLRSGRTRTTHGIEIHELRALFSGCSPVEVQALHPPYATRLARRSILLCQLWDKVPGLKKTHYLALFRKTQAGGERV